METKPAHSAYDFSRVAFGKQLRYLRQRRQLSQERLAELCDFHRNSIAWIERGERKISLESIMHLASALQVRPAELFERMPAPAHRPKVKTHKTKKAKRPKIGLGILLVRC